MDSLKPDELVAAMTDAGIAKSRLSVRDMLIRGFLSGALLGYATSLAITATAQSGLPIVGALIFPCSFVIIILLGLELVTGNFALLPMGLRDKRIRWSALLRNWGWVFAGNLIGSLFYAALLWIALSSGGSSTVLGSVASSLVSIAEAKTIAYQSLGGAGLLTVFVKAILCNWMVCLGVAMAMLSRSTTGKIAAAWLPVFIFFAQGFEHAVVNMFVIPAGIFFGAEVTLAQWWLWNQIPVTTGNIVGGALFVGLALQVTYPRRRAMPPEPLARSVTPAASTPVPSSRTENVPVSIE